MTFHLEGQRLGPYQIAARIGAGGMGEVYQASDTRLDRTVAIKVLTPDIAHTSHARDRLEREARAIATLNHPHICTLHDVGHDGGVDYLVMEYLEGETLAARLARGPVALDMALEVALQIASALDAAHRAGIIHRDLKPGNIFLVRSNSGRRVTAKLLDFGLARSDLARVPPAERSVAATAALDLTTPGTSSGLCSTCHPSRSRERQSTPARTSSRSAP